MSSTQTTAENAAPSSSHVTIAEHAGPGPYHEWRRSLKGVARAALGEFADGCLVHALDLDVAWWCEGAYADETDAELPDRLARLPAGLPGCIDEVVAAARPLLVEDVNRAEEQPARLLRALDASSLVIVPVWAEGRVIAALTFLRCAPRQGFLRGDLVLAEALAATAAIAIVNAGVCARERQAYASLAVSEARFRALVSASAQVVWTTGADGTVAEDSPEWRAFTGQSREQWKELGWLGALHPDDRPRAVAAWERALRDRAAMEVEYRTRRPDGSFCWTVARAAPVFDEDGRLRESVGTNTDVSERKGFEAALQGSEARLRLAVEAAEIGTWDYDPRSGVLVWSEREKALFGLSGAARIDHDTFLRGIHLDDRDRAVKKVERAQDPASGGQYCDEFRTVGLEDGVERWISAQGRCFFDEHGVPTRFIGADVDVTERHRSSQRVALLAEASRALVPGRERGSLDRALGAVARGVAERLGDACWVVLLDESGASLLSAAVEARRTTLLAQMTALHGVRVPVQDDWLGHAVRDRRPRLVPMLDANAEAELLRVEALRPALAGAGLTSLMLAPLVVAEQALGVIVCARAGGRAYGPSDLLMLQDLADRCALAVAEARSFRRAARVHQQIESIIDAVPFPISCVDASGRYTYVSRGYELWFGQPRTQFVGEFVHDVVGAEAYEQLRPMVEGALHGERQQFELTLPYARGGTREVAATYVPQFDEGGRPSGFVAVILDVSEHKALVESLRRSLRFSEEFVGILGHDLRSPLSAISLTSAVLLRQLGDHSAAKPVLRIERSARRMARMIEQILDFTQARLGGGIPVRPAPVDIAILADEIVVEVRSGALHPIELVAEGDARGQWDPDRLGQVFSNLLSNAVQHGRKDTPVRVEVRGTEPDSVQLTVWNAGVIPASVLPAVFDRFQRGDADSASRSQGLGLGLYIVRQIVLAHGGTIEVRSSEEEGTRFAVVLPRVMSASPAIGGT